MDAAERAACDDALLATALLAIDPRGLGGIVVRAEHGPARDHWLSTLRAGFPDDAPWRRIPANISEERLLGGLDLAATLNAGRPVAQRGLLAEADGGSVLLAMAERLPQHTQALLCSALDRGEIAVPREGLAFHDPARFAAIALDEGIDDEGIGAALADRLALHLQLPERMPPDLDDGSSRERIQQARARLAQVRIAPAQIEALCATALRLGIHSLRASSQALNAARSLAAWHARETVADEDLLAAARLVLAPRATTLPTTPSEAEASPSPEAGQDRDGSERQPERSDPAAESPENGREAGAEELTHLVIDAAVAALPSGVLERLRAEASFVVPSRGPAGKVGAKLSSLRRGRPCGTRRGTPAAGQRLSLIDTLRAAAPWQPLRRAESRRTPPDSPRIEVRREDFHLRRLQERQRSTTIFVVDASGSAALHRLAEAKGAVQLLLAECYVRRDEVAMIAFRGSGAELVLPPTRALARAKRCLAGLPAGGGTPLAAGIEAGLELAQATRRRGADPVLVLLTDGRANLCRDGRSDRRLAEEQSRAAARRVRAALVETVFIDTSPVAQTGTRELAGLMNARYLALPRVESQKLLAAVRAARPAK